MDTKDLFSPEEMFSRYLADQIASTMRGLGRPESEEGQATPFDAAPLQPVDTAQAWRDAIAAAGASWPDEVPPDWAFLVQHQEPLVAIPFCLGNYPQLVRSLHPLLNGEFATLQPPASAPLSTPAMLEWIASKTDEPDRYLAAGVARLARQFDVAEQMLARVSSSEWKTLHANELGALAWHRGDHSTALDCWNRCEESVPVLFNRGMASLFLQDAANAQRSFDSVIARLSEDSAWYHLAELYRLLAGKR